MNLKERIDRIIYTSEIELDGGAYKAKYELNNRKSIKEFILDKLRLNNNGKNKVYTNIDTGEKITLSVNSAGKLAGHYGETHQKTIVHIPQIIERMQFLEEMLPDKENAKYGKYSYYITKTKIDGESHTILSTVGYNKDGIYYDHNVFKGTSQEVFKEAKNSTMENAQYSRLKEILKNIDEGDWNHTQVTPWSLPTASIDKYNKNSGDVQGKSEKNEP
jgi:hypothetical protein